MASPAIYFGRHPPTLNRFACTENLHLQNQNLPVHDILFGALQRTVTIPQTMVKRGKARTSLARVKLSSSLSFSLLSLVALLPATTASTHDSVLIDTSIYRDRDTSPRISERQASTVPIHVENLCRETVWPAFATQAGVGPEVGGFILTSGSQRNLTVSHDWQGRIWGRTNCSFNAAGTGPSNLNGNNGAGRACGTGDCNGVLNCVVTVSIPRELLHI